MIEIIKIILSKFKQKEKGSMPVQRGPAGYNRLPVSAERIDNSFFELPPQDADIIVIVNQKGGCGKTTTSVNLSAYLAHIGYKVLLIDMDPQAHASLGLGIKVDSLEHSLYDCFIRNIDMEKIICPTQVSGLDIVPANNMLSGAALEIANIVGRESILKAAIRRIANKKYDFVFIDSSPSLSLLTLNALVASKFVLIPMQVHYYSLEGMKELFSTIDIVKDRLNSDLRVLGILPTMFDSRIKMNKQILEQICSHFKDKMFRTVINTNTKLCEAPFYKKPIHLYDPSSRGAQDYINLAGEVLARLNRRKEESVLPSSVDAIAKDLISGIR